MREYFLKTERIGFSKWKQEDLELAKLLWGDTDVTKFVCAGDEFSESTGLYHPSYELKKVLH